MTPTESNPSAPITPKLCLFKGCGKPISGPFPLCEDCRTIENRNIWALLTDPETPPQFRTAGINKLLTQMTGPEALARTALIEQVYLDFKKVMHQYGISENTKRVQRTLGEDIQSAQSGKNVESRTKQVKSKQSKKQSVAKLLGVSDAEADRWMNEDLDL